ncbi:MAG: DUF4340 domain-containing protein [Bacteroidales bacterium]
MASTPKTYTYLVIIFILVVLSVFVYLQDKNSTLDSALTDFRLDKDEIPDSLVLSRNKQDTYICLSKRGEDWYIDNQLPARQNAIETLLKAMRNLVVEAPVTEASKETVVDLVEQSSIRVEVFDDHIRLKDYYIEDSPYKKDITYMMMTGTKDPFLMNLPGYKGNIADFFRPDYKYWRSKELFDYSGIDIRKVELIYPQKPEISFVLHYTHDDQFILESNHNSEKSINPDISRASRYFSYFSGIEYEAVLDSTELGDSLENATPYCKILVEDATGNKTTLKTYRKSGEGKKDAFGQIDKYDLTYLYGYYNDFGEILLIKYTEIDPLLKEIDYFRVE